MRSELKEKWVTIPEFSFYQVSSFGRVRRHPNKHMVGWGSKRPPGSLLKLSIKEAKEPYLVAHLKSDNGACKIIRIHQTVCECFKGQRPSAKHCALHKDDDKHNNMESNLYWGTKKENAIDRSVNGKHGRAKFTEFEIREIRELHKEVKNYSYVGRKFNADRNTIKAIIQKQIYVWVE